MTNPISPFSQFNTQYNMLQKNTSIRNQNNPVIQNKVEQLSNKKFDYGLLLIPVTTTTIGGIAGFSFSKLHESELNSSLEEQIKEQEADLLKKFDENSDVKKLVNKIQDGEKSLITLDEGTDRINLLIKREKSPKQIASYEKSLEKHLYVVECHKSNLSKLNTNLKDMHTDLVEKPLAEFSDIAKKETIKINKALTKKAMIISLLLGLIAGVTTIYARIKNRKNIQDENNTNKQ